MIAGALIVTLVMAVVCNHQAKKMNYLISVKKYEAEGKNAEAAIQYRNALQSDPYFAEARIGYAKLLLQR